VTGANLNYLIEPALSMVILGAIICTRWFQNAPPNQSRLRYMVIVGALFIQGVWGLAFLDKLSVGKLYDFILDAANEPTQKHLEQMIRNSPGDVINENLTLLIKNHRPVLLGCSYPLAEQGLWNPKRLIEDCKKKRFALAIVEKRIPKMLDLYVCLESKYEKVKPIKKNILIYKPREATDPF
jgi:hypothetical protein